MTDSVEDRRGRFFDLPRRDLWLLPLICLLTVAMVTGAAEVGARVLWPSYAKGDCLATSANGTFSWRANCVAHVRIVDSQPATYQFNECGFRSDHPCGPKPAGAVRLAALGSSAIFGYWVQSQDVLPEVLAARLGRECAQDAEAYNLGIPSATLNDMSARIDAVIRLKADVALLGLSSADLVHTAAAAGPASITHSQRTTGSSLAATARHMLKGLLEGYRLVDVSRHFVYLSHDRYIAAMIQKGDTAALQQPFDTVWQRRLDVTEHAIVDMQGRLAGAGIPLVLIYLPSLGELDLVKEHAAHPDLDPYAVENALRTIAARHSIPFVGPMAALAADAEPDELYFTSDGHMRAQWHRQLAQVVFSELDRSRIGPFEACGRQRASLATRDGRP